MYPFQKSFRLFYTFSGRFLPFLIPLARTKRTRIAASVLCISILCGFTQGLSRTRLDIKTKINEKYELHWFKKGLIKLLEYDGYNICEFDEKYSIWIVETKSASTYYSFRVELCEPCMFHWSRDVLWYIDISFSIPRDVVEKYSDTTITTDEEKDEFTVFIISRAAALALPGCFVAHAFYSAVFASLYSILNAVPTSRQMAETMYGGVKLRDAVRTLLRKVGQ